MPSKLSGLPTPAASGRNIHLARQMCTSSKARVCWLVASVVAVAGSPSLSTAQESGGEAQDSDAARVIVLAPDAVAIERAVSVKSLDEAQTFMSVVDDATRARLLVFPNPLHPGLDHQTNPRGQPVGPGEPVKEQKPKELSAEERKRLEEFRRKAQQEDSWRQCEQAAVSFRGQLERHEAITPSPGSAPDEILVGSRQYESKCLAGPQVSDDGMPSDALRERIGILTDARQPFCSAYVWDETHLITARHCFYDAIAKPRAGVLDQLAKAEIRFERLSEPGVQYTATRLIEPAGLDLVDYDPVSTRVDFVYLQASRSISVARPAPTVADAAPWTAAFVAGYFPYASPVSSDGTGLSASQSIRWAKAGCAVIATRGACVYHACQSVRGFSGAPIFALRGATLEFVGLHTEANGGSGECVVAGHTKGNVGVAATRIRRYPPAM